MLRDTHCKLARVTVRVEEDSKRLIPSAPFSEVSGRTVSQLPVGLCLGNGTHSNVLNTTKTIATKNANARRACWDRRNERYITSIVLDWGLAVDFSGRVTEDVQKYGVIISEGSEYTQ